MLYETISTPSAIDSPTLRDLSDYRNFYDCELPTQRNFVWDTYRKQQLIISLFTNIKPSILTANVINGISRLVDGRQRFTTILQFLDNEFCFDEDTQLKLLGDDTIYDVSNMYFKDLPENLKIKIQGQNVRLEKYSNLSDVEEVNLMIRLNSGKALSSREVSRMKNYGTNVGEIIHEINETDLIKRKVNITKASKNKLLHEDAIINMLYVECNIDGNLEFSNAEHMSKYIRDNNLLTEVKMNEIMETIIYMDLVFPAKRVYLSPKNFVPIYLVCKDFRHTDEREMLKILDGFFEIKDNEYSKLNSSNWNSKVAIMKRYGLLSQYVQNVINDEKLA